jgi:hypothetical protein
MRPRGSLLLLASVFALAPSAWASTAVPASCPVTRPPDPPFRPSAPYPATPPGKDRFWYGTPALWLPLSLDGSWSGGKQFVWRQGYSGSKETRPALTVIGRRLDGEAPPLKASRATNAWHKSFGGWAMLIGAKVPTTGCWAITTRYRDHEVDMVVWVPRGFQLRDTSGVARRP